MPGALRPIINKMQLKKLLSENKTDEVFSSLMELSENIKNNSIKNAIINLSAQYKRFSDQVMLNTSNAEEQNVTLSSLNRSILTLIDEIPPETFGDFVLKRKIDLTSGTSDFERNILNKGVMIIFLILLGISVLGLLGSIILLFVPKYDNNLIKMLLFISFAILSASVLIYFAFIKSRTQK